MGYILFVAGAGLVIVIVLIVAFVVGARRKDKEPPPPQAGQPGRDSWSTPPSATKAASGETPKAAPDDTCDAPASGDHV